MEALMHTEFLQAVQAGNASAVRELLDRDPSLATTRDAAGVSALMHALYRGHTPVLDLLRAAHPQLDIFEASSLGDSARIDQLLRRDPKLVNARSADGFTALHFACYFTQEEAMRMLLAAGADVTAVSNNPMQLMPLHSAASARNLPAVRALLDHGAPVNAKQQQGWAPLHAAAQNGDAEMYRFLVSRGADPNQPNDDGVTAAQLAKKSGIGDR
jgi:ankyrin repeat protein